MKIKNKIKESNRKVGKWLYWTPRFLSILFVLFLSLFSLDVFELCNGFLECFLGLFMHNLLSIALLIILIIAWKYEWFGGIFILFGIGYIFLLLRNPVFEWYMISWSLIIAGPAIFVGILWIWNWKKKRAS